MKLSHLKTEAALVEARTLIGELLAESISDYLALTIAQLKNDKAINLDQFAEVIGGLRILGKEEHRETITKDDIGINPNSYKELFNLLNAIPRDGKLNHDISSVFTALKSIAPSIFKKTRLELETFEKGSRSEKQQLIQKLSAFMTKVNRFFYLVKHGAVQPKGETKASTDIETAYAEVGQLPI